MKNIRNYVLLCFYIIPCFAWSQTEDDFYNLVSVNVMGAFRLNAAPCQLQKYSLKNLYFVDQDEARNQPPFMVNCKNFETIITPLQKLEQKIRPFFKTHYHLKNLNLIIADILKNAVFEPSINTLFAPWFFDAGIATINLKNPVITLPIILHEYGHYIVHSNYAIFNLNTRNDSPYIFYLDALHELMADLLPVIDSQDPNLMIKALQSTKLLQYPKGIPSTDIFIQEKSKSQGEIKLNKYLLVARDFDDRRNDLDYILSKMKNGDKAILQGYFYAPHSLLSPVRKFLWDRAISNPLLRQKLGTAGMTKYLFDELGKFYAHVLKNRLPSVQGDIQSFEMINRELIKWLNKSLNHQFPEQFSR